jgi:hypothetical protein
MAAEANVIAVVTVRLARADDADAIGRIQVETWRAAYTGLMLWVLEGNERAERFYRAAGWEQDGSRVDEFQGVAVSELRYRKGL